MKRIHIVGRKNHGKTLLVEELVGEFSRRGLRVGAIKHTHHRHELDTPGKDSHRHRTAGAAVVGVLSPSMSAVFLPAERSPAEVDRYAALAPLFSDCNVVLVEGDSQTDAAKIEVWRAAMDTPPQADDDASVLAIVSNDAPRVRVPKLPRNDIVGVADWIQEYLQLS